MFHNNNYLFDKYNHQEKKYAIPSLTLSHVETQAGILGRWVPKTLLYIYFFVTMK